MVIAITHYARIAIAQVFLRGYVLQNGGGGRLNATLCFG